MYLLSVLKITLSKACAATYNAILEGTERHSFVSNTRWMSTEFFSHFMNLIRYYQRCIFTFEMAYSLLFLSEGFHYFSARYFSNRHYQNYDREHSGIKSCALEQWKKYVLKHVNNTVCPCIHTKYSNLLHRLLHIIVAEKHICTCTIT